MATASVVFGSCHCRYFTLFVRSSLIILVESLPLIAHSYGYLYLILSVVCASVHKLQLSLCVLLAANPLTVSRGYLLRLNANVSAVSYLELL
jgi:hypothetical protein